jgi:transcription elongation factor Elf1
MAKLYRCPHCDTTNSVADTFDEKLEENLPGGVGKGSLVVVASAFNPLVGAGLATYFAAEAVYKYLNGATARCGNCGEEFKI